MRRATLVRSLLGLLLGGLASCGGGSSGGSLPLPPESLISGPYHYALAGGEFGPPPDHLAQWGIGAADGAGHVSVTSFTQNVNDVVSPGTPFDFLYSVGALRQVALSDASGTFAQGGASDDGDVVAAATTRTGSLPSVLLLLRASGAFSDASLAGTYHFFVHGSFGGVGLLEWGTVTFDGVGGFTREMKLVLAGVPNGSLADSGTYAVAPDGTLTMSGGLAGGLLQGGDVAFLAGPTSSPPVSEGASDLAVLVRQSTSASITSVSGAFTLVGRRIAHPSGAESVQTGGAVVTSPGEFVTDVQSNEEGTIGPPQAATIDFTVGPDGELVLLGDDVYVGAVSPDGHLVVGLGGITYGADAQVLLLVR